MHVRNAVRYVAVVGLALTLGACATVESPDETDPFESANRTAYGFNDSLDRNFFKPVAKAYANVTPDPVRDSVTNFFNNVSYLNVLLNDILQGKIGQFVQDSGRFVVNSTIGIGGLFDPATQMGLARHNEDLGQTFGTWGAGEGAYLVLPFVGPNSVRDMPDIATSTLLNPLTYLNAVVTIPLNIVNLINTRANFLEATDFVDQAAIDPYTFVRESYRQSREFQIYDGNPPDDEYEQYIEDDGGVLKVF